ncbi:MAG: dienelactone hydrolase family protein [Burkholderiaceae bacterium]
MNRNPRCRRLLLAMLTIATVLMAAPVPGTAGEGPDPAVPAENPPAANPDAFASPRSSVHMLELPDPRGSGEPILAFVGADAPADPAASRRLVVVSHGSGGGPAVHRDLIEALVAAGYVVVVPAHVGDNHRGQRLRGPDSWKQRPAEISAAIDSVAADQRLGARVATDRVGVYGMSAGGHAALSVAGGVWSPMAFRRHCDAHLADDFQTCVGLTTSLTGGPSDGIKQWIARTIIDAKFDDDTPQAYEDRRIAAIVAAVPVAADFDIATLTRPRVPLGLLTAARDAWLVPRFHADRVLAACLPRCEHLADLPTGGHGAYLSPLPNGMSGLAERLLGDPPGFDRGVLPAIDRKIVAFFDRHLD